MDDGGGGGGGTLLDDGGGIVWRVYCQPHPSRALSILVGYMCGVGKHSSLSSARSQLKRMIMHIYRHEHNNMDTIRLLKSLTYILPMATHYSTS